MRQELPASSSVIRGSQALISPRHSRHSAVPPSVAPPHESQTKAKTCSDVTARGISLAAGPAWTRLMEATPMPEQETIERAREDAREGKSPSTQAGEFVREEIHHIREGKHGARSTKQAIAIGLSKARRAGVRIPRKGTAARRKTSRTRKRARPSARRSRAVRKALKREGRRSASRRALSRQAKSAARRRSSAQRSAAARKASRTKGPRKRSAAARKAARTRARRR